MPSQTKRICFVGDSHLVHNLALLGLERGIDLFDSRVGHVLHFAFPKLLVIFRHPIRLGFLDLIHPVTPHIAHRNACVFSVLRGDLGQLAPPLFVELGNGQHDDRAVQLRIDPQPAFPDRLFDFADQAFVPDIDGDHPGLGHIDRADLIDRRHRAIGIDHHRIQHRRRGAARSERGKLGPQIRQRPVHTALQIVGIQLEIFGHLLLRGRHLLGAACLRADGVECIVWCAPGRPLPRKGVVFRLGATADLGGQPPKPPEVFLARGREGGGP